MSCDFLRYRKISKGHKFERSGHKLSLYQFFLNNKYLQEETWCSQREGESFFSLFLSNFVNTCINTHEQEAEMPLFSHPFSFSNFYPPRDRILSQIEKGNWPQILKYYSYPLLTLVKLLSTERMNCNKSEDIS